MSKLEEIKRAYGPNYREYNHVNWLIQQAERVKELESENTKLNKEIGYYAGQLSSIKEEMNMYLTELGMLSNRMMHKG